MRFASAVAIDVAVFLLPRHLRERYCEQWNADVRDAEEAGIQRSEIARGALAFAVTLGRPTPFAPQTVRPEVLRRRSRLAAALSLSSALVGLSLYANAAGGGGQVTNNTVLDFIHFVAVSVLALFVVVSVVVAAVLVSITRGVHPRVRTAVWLLIVAGTSPLVASQLDSTLTNAYSVYLTPGGIAYVVGFGLVVAASLLLVRQSGLRARAKSQRLVVSALLTGIATLAVAALGLVHAIAVWAARDVPEYSWNIGLACDDTVCTVIPATSEMFAAWALLKEQFEQLVVSVFVVWGIAGVLFAIVVATLVFFTGIRPVVATVAAVSVLLIAHAGVMTFLYLGTFSAVPVVPTDVMFLLGRWMLVAVVLYGVGGVRLEPRTRRSVEEPVAS